MYKSGQRLKRIINKVINRCKFKHGTFVKYRINRFEKNRVFFKFKHFNYILDCQQIFTTKKNVLMCLLFFPKS